MSLYMTLYMTLHETEQAICLVGSIHHYLAHPAQTVLEVDHAHRG